MKKAREATKKLLADLRAKKKKQEAKQAREPTLSALTDASGEGAGHETIEEDAKSENPVDPACPAVGFGVSPSNKSPQDKKEATEDIPRETQIFTKNKNNGGEYLVSFSCCPVSRTKRMLPAVFLSFAVFEYVVCQKMLLGYKLASNHAYGRDLSIAAEQFINKLVFFNFTAFFLLILVMFIGFLTCKKNR
jgi:hypothetical protein